MELNFKFSVEEANLILAALAKQPFETVVNLITKIQEQAKSQLDNGTEIATKS